MIDDITSFSFSPLVNVEASMCTMASFLIDLKPGICSVLFCVLLLISISCAYGLNARKGLFFVSFHLFRYTITFLLPSNHVISYHLVLLFAPPFSLH